MGFGILIEGRRKLDKKMSSKCDKCGEHALEWVSIKDKLPEDYQYVLVYGTAKATGEPCPISIARCFKGEWEMLNHSEESNSVACGDLTWYMSEDEITHWVDLPLPPDRMWKNY